MSINGRTMLSLTSVFLLILCFSWLVIVIVEAEASLFVAPTAFTIDHRLLQNSTTISKADDETYKNETITPNPINLNARPGLNNNSNTASISAQSNVDATDAQQTDTTPINSTVEAQPSSESLETSTNGNSNEQLSTTDSEPYFFPPTLKPVTPNKLPASVDIMECRHHLQVADADRDHLLTEEEYVTFIHQIVTHAFNHSLVNIPAHHKDPWASTHLDEFPMPVRSNYNDLVQGGMIPVTGYKVDDVPEPTLAQTLFLMKVCIQTEISVYKGLEEEAANELPGQEDAMIPALALPDPEVVTIYSSFAISNPYAIKAEHLSAESNTDRLLLELAYQMLVTKVVGTQLGMELTLPATAAARKIVARTSRDASRRCLTTALDPRLPELYRIDDTPCFGTPANVTGESLQTNWCQIVYGKFMLYIVPETQEDADVNHIFQSYSTAVQTATDNGQLQSLVEMVMTEANVDGEVTVTGAGPSILPPLDTTPPTKAPKVSPASTPSTAPQAATKTTKEEDGKSNLTLILVLAGVLGTVNFCIIGASLFMCWRNRNNPDNLGFDDYSDEGTMMEDAYNIKGTEAKARSFKKGKQRSETRSRKDMSSSAFSEDDEIVSNPPTLDDIVDANRMPGVGHQESDAKERERILRGGDSDAGTTAAPTMEDIEAALSGPKTFVDSNYGWDEDEQLPIGRGELA